MPASFRKNIYTLAIGALAPSYANFIIVKLLTLHVR